MAPTCTRAGLAFFGFLMLGTIAPPGLADDGPKSERTDLYGDTLPAGAVARIGRLGLRHAAEVQSLAFSPDGKFLASSSSDATLRIWEATSAREVHRLVLDSRLQRDGQQVAFSPDGKLLAFTSQDQTIFFWSTADWKERERLQGPSQHGTSPVFAFAPDGNTFVWGANDNVIRLRDLAAGKNLRQWPGRLGHVPRFAFSPDSKRLAVSSSLTTTILDVAGGKELCQFQEERYAPYSIAFAPDGKTLAVGGFDNVRLCDAATGKEKRRLTGHAMPVLWMHFTPDGSALIASGADGTCRVWDPETGREVRRFVLEQKGETANPIRQMALAPDGKTLARVAWKNMNRILLTDVATGHDLRSSGDDPNPYHFAFASDGKALAAPCSDGTARLWEIATGKELRRFLQAEDKPSYFDLSADGKTLVSLGKRLTVWDATTAKLRHHGATPPLKFPYPAACALSPDGKLLAIGEVDSSGGRNRPAYSTFWWDLDKDKVQSRSPETNGRQIESLAFTPDSKATVSADRDGWVYLWDPTTGKALWRVVDREQIHAIQLALSSEGKTLLVARSRFVQGRTAVRIGLHDPATGKELSRPPEAVAQGRFGAFSADGQLVAFLDDNAAVGLWEVATGNEIAKTQGRPGQAMRIRFAPDGKTLAVGNSDGTILVWDIAALRKQ